MGKIKSEDLMANILADLNLQQREEHQETSEN